jgi:hypothetical protein
MGEIDKEWKALLKTVMITEEQQYLVSIGLIDRKLSSSSITEEFSVVKCSGRFIKYRSLPLHIIVYSVQVHDCIHVGIAPFPFSYSNHESHHILPYTSKTN